MSLTHKSQSALEYMMTYGWAILIIVIVAGVLYSFGVFNPSSSASATITGFSGLGSPQALCMANGGLRLQLGNNIGQTINVTRINVTSNGVTETVLPNQTISPQGTYIFYVPNVCGNSAGTRYSFTSSVTYTEPGQVFQGPYFSSGTASGTVSATQLPGEVASFDNGYNYSTAYVSTPYYPMNYAQFSYSAWFYSAVYGSQNCCKRIVAPSDNGPVEVAVSGIGVGVIALYGYNVAGWINVGPNFNYDSWNFIEAEYNGTAYNVYLNGALIWDKITTITGAANNSLTFGDNNPPGSVGGDQFFGYISNVQAYAVALTSTQVQQLYAEGIVGAPLSVGSHSWWYLNGTSKDFGSNNKNGASTNVVFTSNYPAP